MRFALIGFFLLSVGLQAQVSPGKYIIFLKDKNHSDFSISQPEKFLSKRALNRRAIHGISVDESDFPVSKYYLDSLQKLGLHLINTSRWYNWAMVSTNDTTLMDTIDHFGFVAGSLKSAPLPVQKSFQNKLEIPSEIEELTDDFASPYGLAWPQIHLHHGEELHRNGFRGNGIQIAVLDAGFYKVNELPAFDSLFANGQILGMVDFVTHDTDVFADHSHGMNVLSIMGGNIPGSYVGSAPGASYWLLRSEDDGSEYIVEEYNWISAAEFADSAGADIITSSLGYTRFNNPNQNHRYEDMDGQTAPSSKAADKAFSKGMLVIVSAGNEGNTDWKYISAPSDAFKAISVAAVDTAGTRARFSSMGPSSDGRTKPDVASVGWGTYVQNNNGTFSRGSGTSFAAPLMAGLSACLWQAYPKLTNDQIRTIIQTSGNRFRQPDSLTGYGIPDFNYSLQIGKSYLPWLGKASDSLYVYPNPFTSSFSIRWVSHGAKNLTLSLRSMSGAIWYREEVKIPDFSYPLLHIQGLETIPPGIYLLLLETERYKKSTLLQKQ